MKNNEIGRQVHDISEELRQSIKQYATEPDAPNVEIIKISDKIESLFKETAAKIASKTDARPLTEKKLRAQQAEIQRINNGIKRISDEIQNQTDNFNSQIDDEKKKFKTISNDLAEHFYEQNQNMTSTHEIQMLELNEELQDLKESFDAKLQDEKEKVVIEKKLLKKVYQSFQKEFRTMKTELESDLKEIVDQTSELENEIKTNYGESQQKIEELRAKIEATKNSGASELEKIESENRALKKSIDLMKAENDPKINDLNDKVLQNENDFEIKKSELLRENQPKYESEISALTEKIDLIEKELTNKLEGLKSARSSQTDALQSELVSLKSEVNSIDSKIAKKLKIARIQNEAKVLQKDSELKQLRSDHLKFVETTRHAYQNEVSRVRNENENQFVLLQQSLLKTVANNDQQQRRNNRQMVAAAASKGKNVKEPTSGAPSQTPRRLKNVQPSQHLRQLQKLKQLHGCDEDAGKNLNENVSKNENLMENLLNKFEAQENQSKKLLSDFVDSKKRVEMETKVVRAKACAQINELEKATKQIKDEINDLALKLQEDSKTNEITETNETNDKTETIETNENNEKNEGNKNNENDNVGISVKELELKKAIEQQKIAIQQLKEEKERLRVDVSKRKALQSLQLKHRQDLAEIERKIDELTANANKEAANTADEMVKIYKEEQKKSRQMIQEATIKLENALKALLEAKTEVEEVSLKDRQKWNELRSGISDSTLTICQKLNNSASTRPTTSSSPTIRNGKSQSMLPPLKKD